MGSAWERRIRVARKVISVLMKTDGCSLNDVNSQIPLASPHSED